MANTIRDSAGAKYVEMQNGRFARLLDPSAFASGTWGKIRIALYMSMFDTGTTVGSTPIFQVGLCSGTSNIPGDATPTNAVGLNVTAASWAYYNGGASYKIYNCGTCYPFKNVGGTLTNGTSSTSVVFTTTGSADGLAAEFYVDITRGSPNYTVQLFCPTAGAPGISEATFETQSLVGTPVITNHGFLTAQTIAFDESAGSLSAAFVYYNQIAAYGLIRQMRVIRLS